MKNGFEDIKKHRFFKSIDWKLLKERSYPHIPYIPKFDSPSDTCNFRRYNELDSNVSEVKCPPLTPESDPFLSW